MIILILLLYVTEKMTLDGYFHMEKMQWNVTAVPKIFNKLH